MIPPAFSRPSGLSAGSKWEIWVQRCCKDLRCPTSLKVVFERGGRALAGAPRLLAGTARRSGSRRAKRSSSSAGRSRRMASRGHGGGPPSTTPPSLWPAHSPPVRTSIRGYYTLEARAPLCGWCAWLVRRRAARPPPRLPAGVHRAAGRGGLATPSALARRR
jgi:hypothetical protein